MVLKLPFDLTRFFMGLLLLCVLAGEALNRYRLVIRREAHAMMEMFPLILATILHRRNAAADRRLWASMSSSVPACSTSVSRA